MSTGPGRGSPMVRRRRGAERERLAWRAGFAAGERSAAELLAAMPRTAGELLEELLRDEDGDEE